MNTLDSNSPNWVSPPGDTISDILGERDISFLDFKSLINLSELNTKQLLDGKLRINSALAERLAIVLGASQSFWLEREKQYCEALARINQDLEHNKKYWLSSLPIKEMVKLGWLPKAISQFQEFIYCLDFFGVDSLDEWKNAYQNKHSTVAFKTSQHFISVQGALDAWIRQGELLSERIECNSWDKNLFISILPWIRNLTREKSPSVFVPKLQEACASCGVAVVIVRAPTGCKASGATKFVRDDKAMIIMSFRHLSDDHFWFTFFHEAGHLILHDSNLIFIDDESIDIDEKVEREANDFSKYLLIPREYDRKLYEIANDGRLVLRFAREIGISPGIVVGQLQKKNIIPYSHLNRLKTRFEWL